MRPRGVLGAVFVTLIATAPAMLRAQGAAVEIQGLLRNAVDGGPVPYATVSIVENGRGVFADADGGFRIAHLAPGHYTLRVRQIGFVPVDTAVTLASGTDLHALVFHLQRIPANLARIRIEGRQEKHCRPGAPDSTANPALAAIFAQVRENVDRFLLLLDQYPFTYLRDERRFERLDPGGEQLIEDDTVSYDSRTRRPYRVGQVVFNEYAVTGQRKQIMYLPSFRDLAEPAFLTSHCFSYKGTVTLPDGGGLALRVDFRPIESIVSPDVEGSIYLHAERFVVKRAVFRLTRPETVVPPVAGLTVTTTFRELIPLLPLVDSVDTEQPMLGGQTVSPSGVLGPNEGTHNVAHTAVERYRLLSYSFVGAAPGASAGVAAAADAEGGNSVVQAPAPLPTILSGRVIQSDGTPVAGATITFGQGRDTTTASDSGRFTLHDVTPGARMLVARHVGFLAARVPVTIVRGQMNDVTVTMAVGVRALPTVKTTETVPSAYRDVGLDKRLQRGVGQIVTYDKIEQRQATKFTDLLQLLHGCPRA